jgi:phage terminase large subunit-like protein
MRQRIEYPELKGAVREQYERFRPSVVLIEDKAPGNQLIQELIEQGLHGVTRLYPQTDKVMRMHAQTTVPVLDPGIENGSRGGALARPYLHERADDLPARQARR